MPKTYILIDSSGTATIIGEKDIERVAAERMVAGEPFELFQAEPMRLQLTLSPVTDGGAPTIPAPARRVGRKKAVGKKTGRKKFARKKAARKTTARKKTGKVGRPPVNVGPCTVGGCDRPSKTRGLCSAHYQQHRRLMREGKAGLMGTAAGAAPAPAPTATRGKRVTRRKATRRKAAGKVATGSTAGKRATRKSSPRQAKSVEQAKTVKS